MKLNELEKHLEKCIADIAANPVLYDTQDNIIKSVFNSGMKTAIQEILIVLQARVEK